MEDSLLAARMGLYVVVEDPLTCAWVSDANDDCDDLEAVAELAETTAYYAQIAANKARGYARKIRRMIREAEAKKR